VENKNIWEILIEEVVEGVEEDFEAAATAVADQVSKKEVSVVIVVEIEKELRCTKQLAVNVARFVKFHSVLQMISQFTVMIVSVVSVKV
jgi:hypothetical protein